MALRLPPPEPLYWGGKNKPTVTKSASELLQEKREALAATSAEDRKEFLDNARWRQELLKTDPARYHVLRAGCVAEGRLGPLPQAPQKTAEKHYDETELLALAKWSGEQIDNKLKAQQARREDTLMWMQEHQPQEYAKFVLAAVLRGKMPAERLESLRQSQVESARKPDTTEAPSVFELSEDLCKTFGLPVGYRATLPEYEAMTAVHNQVQQAKTNNDASQQVEQSQ